MIQAHIIYSGIVQGVGFRFTVQRYALSLDLTGWVRNLSDGSVEILVNGPKENIEKFCEHLQEYFGKNIHNKKIQYKPATDIFADFEITY